jgi:hypothetical protein
MTLDLFERMYKTIARSNASNALTAITLKNAIKQQRDFYVEMCDENALQEFEELVIELSNFFNVENNLQIINATLLCIKFETDTGYYKLYGSKEVCGNLVAIINNVPTQRLEDNKFTEKISSYGIKFKCQYGELDIAIGDFKEIETA